MKQIFRVQIKDGAITFHSDYHKAMFRQFLKENNGLYLKITPDEAISTNMRGYFEGGLVPFFALQHFVVDPDNGHWTVMSQREARECLKREFNPTYFRDLSGKTVKAGESTASLNKKEFGAFIERCVNYFEQNGYEIPNPDEFKNWRDSCPEIDEMYPPILRLKDMAEKRLLELNGYATIKPISQEYFD